MSQQPLLETCPPKTAYRKASTSCQVGPSLHGLLGHGVLALFIPVLQVGRVGQLLELW